MKPWILAALLATSLVGCAGLTERDPIVQEGRVVGYEPSILDEILSAGAATATETDLKGDLLEGDWLGLALGGAATVLAGGGAGVAAYKRKKKKEAETPTT